MFELFTKEVHEDFGGQNGPLSAATCNLCEQMFDCDYIDKYIISKIPQEKIVKLIEIINKENVN